MFKKAILKINKKNLKIKMLFSIFKGFVYKIVDNLCEVLKQIKWRKQKT